MEGGGMESTEAEEIRGATSNVQTGQETESQTTQEESTTPVEAGVTPAPPPRPPRDINPFGEPDSPPSVDTTQEQVEPPRPTSPPPPIPSSLPPNGATLESEDADSSSDTPIPAEAVRVPEPTTSSSINLSAPSPSLLSRRKALDETRLFEQQRRDYFGEKFEGDSLYWKSFVELIRRSQANNRRAINYATQKLAAGAAYAKALYAIRDTVDSLEPGTTEARCEKERNKKGPKTWPPVPPQEDPSSKLQQSQQQQQAEQKEQQGQGQGQGQGKGQQGDGAGGSINVRPPPSALESMFAMEEYTAMRFLDVCEEASVNVVQKRLKAMVKSLDDQFSEMVGQGTACLRLMHAAETNSGNAFARYSNAVSESLKYEQNQGLRPTIVAREAISSDVWLADMNYRVAVTQQGRVWKGASMKLGELFNRMKDIEVERRQAIQAGLVALVQLHDGLLRDLPVLKDPVLQSLDRINVDRNLLDQEVRNEMRKGAARLRATRQDGGIVAGSVTDPMAGSVGSMGGGSERSFGGDGGFGPSAAGGVLRQTQGANGEAPVPLAAPDFIKNLESPLASKLIARSTMLDRREKSMLGGRWILVLGILTHDSYLLLFDVPRNCNSHKKQLNARTSEAFAELVPKPEVESLAAEWSKSKDTRKKLDSNGLPVPPSVVVDLSACKVVFKPDGKSDAMFEITEIRTARGMKGVFRDYSETKYTLRGRSQEAMVDWVCQIKDMGSAGLKAMTDGKK